MPKNAVKIVNFSQKCALKKIWSLPLDLTVKFWLNFCDEFQVGWNKRLMQFLGYFWGKIPLLHSL